MDKRHDTVLETLMEQLIEGGAENMGLVFARVFDPTPCRSSVSGFLAPSITSAARLGRATPMATRPSGSIHPRVQSRSTCPKRPDMMGNPSIPNHWNGESRSTRAVMLAVAEMYVKGVSTREVEAVMREFRIESL